MTYLAQGRSDGFLGNKNPPVLRSSSYLSFYLRNAVFRSVYNCAKAQKAPFTIKFRHAVSRRHAAVFLSHRFYAETETTEIIDDDARTFLSDRRFTLPSTTHALAFMICPIFKARHVLVEVVVIVVLVSSFTLLVALTYTPHATSPHVDLVHARREYQAGVLVSPVRRRAIIC